MAEKLLLILKINIYRKMYWFVVGSSILGNNLVNPDDYKMHCHATGETGLSFIFWTKFEK